MINKIKFYIITLGFSGMLAMPGALVPMAARALGPDTTGLCTGASLNIEAGTCTNTSSNIDGIIHFVLEIFSVIVGIIAVIMIVVGGLKYIISGGEASKTAGAKDTILFAIVGLVVVALAQVIVHFVLTSVNANGGS